MNNLGFQQRHERTAPCRWLILPSRVNPFFSRVITSGGHLYSLQAVANGEAAVSLRLIASVSS